MAFLNFFSSLLHPDKIPDHPSPFSAKIYFQNTLTGKKELFTPLIPKEVRMYNCGPTVYSYAHIGNLRPYVFADTVRRIFIENGYTVKQVINITDVGHLTSDSDDGADKMEEGARREGKTAREVAALYTDAFFKNLTALNIETEDILFPRATEHISEQISLISELEKKGYTYRTDDGIYFDTSKFKNYGALGNINLEGLKEGARVDKKQKHTATDFALWKFSDPQEKRQQEWTSPWGTGFPGWHIECSAMSMKYLGTSFDVHTGGVDHIPIHHNNEIAQSEAATDRRFAHYWMHNEFLMVEGRKISKSLGNTITLQQIIDRNFSPLALRYFFLGGRYDTTMNFTWEALAASQVALTRLRKYFVEKLSNATGGIPNAEYHKRFVAYLHDAVDTPRALALIWDLLKDTTVPATEKRATLLAADRYLGLSLNESDSLLSMMRGEVPIDAKDIPEEIGVLVRTREDARKAKDWKRSDELRSILEEKGYTVKDLSDKTLLLKRE